MEAAWNGETEQECDFELQQRRMLRGIVITLITIVGMTLSGMPENNNLLMKRVSVIRGETSSVMTDGEQFQEIFSIFPSKKSETESVTDIKLIPGGQAIGVVMQSQGVIVVGQAAVNDAAGKKSYPAREAGIKVGDLIMAIEGKAVKSDSDVAQAVHDAGYKGEKVKITIKRGELQEIKYVKPVLCPETNRYRVGLYVRDKVAGVGTLTFIEPTSNKYGALGHIVNDSDTSQKVQVADGKVMASSIQSIQPGKRGEPGEKIGTFLQDSAFSGNIKKNTAYGIFGEITGKSTNPLYQEPISVASIMQTKTGPAIILTVINGEKIEAFDIIIERVMPTRNDGKGMVIRVIDPRLLESAGGIVQGMSGSPIIQNNKIVGAITHVFIQDPSRGYGCFIEQMLREADLLKVENRDAA